MLHCSKLENSIDCDKMFLNKLSLMKYFKKIKKKTRIHEKKFNE